LIGNILTKDFSVSLYSVAMEKMLVKNMVCRRCVISVESILHKYEIPVHKVISGEIHLKNELSREQRVNLSEKLKSEGFELIDNHSKGLIERIKILVIRRARNETDKTESKLNLSKYLSEKLHYEYTHLSSTFSEAEGRTIENFYIEQRIEKAKELILYGQLTLSEIAFELDYKSSAYLSSQFKKITGTTPSNFKELGTARLKVAEKV
jgi:AraC family transcriptional regulator